MIKDRQKKSPLFWVPTAYFAMGLPFVVLNMVCVLMFKGLGIRDAQITFWTSMIMFPWTLKFLWSPFLEFFKTKKIIVVATQILSGVGFGLVALALKLPDFFAISIAVLAVVGFSGATHDVALDGLYMAELSKEQQAKFIGWQGAFYNLAKLFATGALVAAAGWLIDFFSVSRGMDSYNAALYSWAIVMGIISVILILLGLYHYYSLPFGSNAKEETSGSKWKELSVVLSSFFTKKNIVLYIAFIILYRLGEGFVMKIVPLFLKETVANGGLGLSEKSIGTLYGICGSAAFILGSVISGYFVAHYGLKKCLLPLICIFNFPFLVYTYLAWAQPDSLWLIGGGIIFEYFGYGFGFVGLTLFMMQEVAPGRHQMAHYAFASAIMNLSVMLTGAVSGYLSEHLGYKYFFTVVLVAIIPVFIISYFLPLSSKEELKEVTE